MKSKFLYWTLILLLTLGITILVQILFREYRFSHLSNLAHIGTIEFIFTAFLLPIYLSTVYFALNRKFKFVVTFYLIRRYTAKPNYAKVIRSPVIYCCRL